MADKVATVVVVGDIGRSPRMLYHSHSLLQQGYKINIVGYLETVPIEELTSNSNFNVVPLRAPPDINLPSVLKYLFKCLWIAITLWWVLLKCIVFKKSDILLYQNPPAVPGLVVACLVCSLSRCKLILDWHNYTHSILALSLPKTHILVRISKQIEILFGRMSHANFCVTKAMQQDLKTNFKINAVVLYDRPFSKFKQISLKEKHDLFIKLSDVYPELKEGPNSTVFTQQNELGIVEHKKGRSALLVSSTSWTQDEDFGILLSALEKYETKANIFTGYPNLVCIITGKGPEKAKYQKLIKNKDFQKVKILTPWLETEDYPKMIASADLGVCLHFSSSGLDLPMKVIDMFGAGLPVCAIDFQCLDELVQHERNGFTFKSEDDLAELLLDWFHDFPDYKHSLNQTRTTIKHTLHDFQKLRWDENWDKVALPVILS